MYIKPLLYVMIFLLYLLIPVSLVNIIITLFFPFPAPLIGIGLQFLFFILSLVIAFSRISRRKGIIRPVVITGIHGFVLFFAINLYVKVVIPHQDKDELSAFKAGASGLIGNIFNKIRGESSKTEISETDSYNKINENSSKPLTDNTLSGGSNYKENVKIEDPF